MTRYEELKTKLKNRETVTMGNVLFSDSPLLLNSMQALDCVLLDKEHGLFDSESLVPMTMHARHLNLPTIVRVEDKQYHLIAKAMDLGADGIMLPRVETVDQVKTAVDAMHFLPVGRTGCGGFGLLRDGEDFETFQKSRILMVQIESHKGLEAMPAMIEAYGEFIDAFIIGPNDYSISEDMPFAIKNPHMLDEFVQVFETAGKYGISCGSYVPDVEHMHWCREHGANVQWVGDDREYVRLGIESFLKEL